MKEKSKPDTSSGLILALETSCDDTSVAVMRQGKLLSHLISSQVEHQTYGGVVPEMASRAHQRQLVWLVDKALQQAAVNRNALDALAVTRGPGLLGSLLVGLSFAKGMAMALDKPLIDVDHLAAHCLAHFIEAPRPPFPFLCLLVSGGHTQLLRINGPLQISMLGRTIDDAAGEAFDKGAKMLGLPYPGGPEIQRHAEKGHANAFRFSQARLEGLHYSFSGLKTSLLYFLRDREKASPGFTQRNLHDICASFQEAIVSSLCHKLVEAARESGIRHVALAGGVAANQALRHRLEQLATQHQWSVYIPRMAYCTDNAAMIAMAAHFKFLEGQFGHQEMVPYSRQAVAVQ